MDSTRAILLVLFALVLLAGCTAVTPPEGERADELGVVDGVDHDEPLDVDNQETVDNESIDEVVARAMARIEEDRGLAFDSTPDVEIITREEFRDRNIGFAGNTGTFDELQYQAIHLVGADEDLDAAFDELYGGAVAGFYSPADGGQVVLIVEDEESFTFPRATLVHELVHALQDQQLSLATTTDTTDEQLAWEGLIEGEADLMTTEYEDRCTSGAWTCAPAGDSAGGGDRSFNQGLFASIFVPYGEGPSFVEHLRGEGDWAAVDDAYDRPPQSTAELIEPERYPFEPRNVTVEDRSGDAWLPVAGDTGGADTLGPALLYTMFWHNRVIPEEHFRDTDSPSGVTYDHPLVTGWTGDEFVGYSTGDKTGFVYRSTWTNATEAERFVAGYRDLLDGHGADRTSEQGVYVVEDGGFAGAYRLDHDGDTVTVVRAPTVEELDAVHATQQPSLPDTSPSLAVAPT